jgi:hypothetical protein
MVELVLGLLADYSWREEHEDTTGRVQHGQTALPAAQIGYES